MARYIDADALMEDLRIVKPITETEAVAFRFAYCKLKDAPTADVRENVHAHWDRVEMKKGEWWHTCSKCKATWGSEDVEIDFNFCPNCGAVMDERGEDGD